ncbi:MAG: hypothetical protein F6K17_17490 [Okeania sp. SIO3C4]|nr:hypothetical protein [Okeania sp. SIO3B3]NER04275.1 hypothetical protein [Okeania sp. SIO3C4]
MSIENETALLYCRGIIRQLYGTQMAIRPYPLYDDRQSYITPKPTDLISGLTQLLTPNIAQTLSVRGKYVAVISQPIKKTVHT